MLLTSTVILAFFYEVHVYHQHTKDNDGPIKSLRGCKRVSIKSGETKRGEIDMPKEDVETWDASTNTMRVIGGEYDIMVGNSSIDADLKHIKVVL